MTVSFQREVPRRMRSERGLTLVELMITVTILTVVLLATFALLDTTRENASRDEERAQSVREAQSGLLRMAKELRHAYRITAAGPNTVTFMMRCSTSESCTSTGQTANSKLITYTCTTECARAVSVTPSGGVCCTVPAGNEEVIKRIQNGSTATCPAPTDNAAAPVFNYKVRDAGNNRVQAACDDDGVAPDRRSATDIDITVAVPAGGEKPNQGYRRSIVLRDAVYLRNRDL